MVAANSKNCKYHMHLWQHVPAAAPMKKTGFKEGGIALAVAGGFQFIDSE
jgi:hypothetical protein